MTGGTQQIVAAYEEAGMSLAEIAQEFPEYDVIAIKACLMQFSRKFYNECLEAQTPPPSSGNEGALQTTQKEAPYFNTFEEERAKQTIASLIDAEDEHIRFRASKFVIDENKGRHDIIRDLRNLNVGIAQFNQHMQKALEVKKRASEKAQSLDASAADREFIEINATTDVENSKEEKAAA